MRIKTFACRTGTGVIIAIAKKIIIIQTLKITINGELMGLTLCVGANRTWE